MNENAHVALKMKPKSDNARNASDTSTSSRSETPTRIGGPGYRSTGNNALVPSGANHRSYPLSYFILSPSLDERATNFFFCYYIIGMDQASSQSPGGTALASDAVDENLIASIKALGLASYGNFCRAPEIRREANSRYLESVQLTNKALRDPRTVKKDSTLLTVMLLSQYETVCGETIDSIKDWTSHVDGATALVKLRGSEQLETRTGLRMFIQAFVNCIITSMQIDSQIPEFMLKLRDEAGKYLDTRALNWRSHDLLIDFLSLRCQYQYKVKLNPSEVLSDAIHLEARIADTFCNDDPSALWAYTRVFLDEPDPENVYGGYYDVYHDFMYATTWNTMRVLRVLLNENIRNTIEDGWLAFPPYFQEQKHIEQQQQAVNNLFTLQADILASVPQHMDYNKARSTASTPEDRSDDQSPYKFLWSAFDRQKRSPVRHDYVFHPIRPNISTIPAIRMSGGSFLPWHLHLAATMDIASPELTQWVSKILQKIGTDMSIKQSLLFGQHVIDGMRLREQRTHENRRNIHQVVGFDQNPEAVRFLGG
ncbi:MAG: hypothetical protein M1828_007358 [Chrysothrix sp. TS-e1954]|nr:MAG: hypothetical protein M1828_007358 [Chrysothrix sp. TS-e1954]